MIPEYLLPKNHKPQRLDSSFLYADGWSYSDLQKQKEYLQYSGLAISEADRNRLVKAAKSPTQEKLLNEAIKKSFLGRKVFSDKTVPLVSIAEGAFSELDAKSRREHQQIKTELAAIAKPIDEPGTCTVVEYREWCEEYRIRTRVNGQMGLAPPLPDGERCSIMLSERGARKIAESCEYMAIQYGGYKTFATGTFKPETRKKIASGESTIQKEVTRTMDAMVKMYQRGWEYKTDKKLVRVPGQKAGNDADKFRYCWVVEIPKNEKGEDNPHIHMLMDWGVEFKHFQPWSMRIESIWSNGTFKLEKIKDKNAAGAYMAKAAGYITKAAGQQDQGKVKGNRYAISAAARAPSWVTLSVHELGIMGRLIRETYDSIQHKYSSEFWQRKKLNESRQKIIDQEKAEKEKHPQKKCSIKTKKMRARIAKKLTSVRETINAIPIRASKYHLVIKDRFTFLKFIQRAEKVGWGSDAPPCTKWIYEQKRRRQRWNEKDLPRYLAKKVDQLCETLSAYEYYEKQTI